jgi:hypothetical protein
MIQRIPSSAVDIVNKAQYFRKSRLWLCNALVVLGLKIGGVEFQDPVNPRLIRADRRRVKKMLKKV